MLVEKTRHDNSANKNKMRFCFALFLFSRNLTPLHSTPPHPTPPHHPHSSYPTPPHPRSEGPLGNLGLWASLTQPHGAGYQPHFRATARCLFYHRSFQHVPSNMRQLTFLNMLVASRRNTCNIAEGCSGTDSSQCNHCTDAVATQFFRTQAVFAQHPGKQEASKPGEKPQIESFSCRAQYWLPQTKQKKKCFFFSALFPGSCFQD